jgi:hypothetical protein
VPSACGFRWALDTSALTTRPLRLLNFLCCLSVSIYQFSGDAPWIAPPPAQTFDDEGIAPGRFDREDTVATGTREDPPATLGASRLRAWRGRCKEV